MCGIAFQHEVGQAYVVHSYSSVEELKAVEECWKECGIVEAEVTLVKWVKKQNLKWVKLKKSKKVK